MRLSREIGLAALFCLLIPGAVLADRDSEEYRLLKSWGMQFNADGRLFFKPGKESGSTLSESPWKPDMSDYQSQAPAQIGQPLEPLVIRSRQAPKP